MTSRTGKLVIDFLEANGNGLVSDRLVVSFDTTGQPVNTAKVIIDAFSDQSDEPFDPVQIGVNGVTAIASFPEVLGPFDPAGRTFAQIDVTSQIFKSGQADFRLEFTSDLEPIPEPITLILWGTTMVGLGLAARWRRRRQS
jgi:MYXO-CTERM domain-containing protein